jgi:uncharacterized protein with HEPN domain
MKKSDEVYRRQIVDAVAKIERFTAGLDKESFLATEVVQSAVIMQLAVIGELSKRLSDEFRKTVALPWKQIAGFRDRAVHDYYQLDLEYVWLTIRDDLPLLKEALDRPATE